ncbi:translation initiation factor IF-2 isoform X3 [Bacillus rossius redtenbacheri]|uniref:translation initiation factor IF-2 isoform X3 n=1 Tax=Bacillus rossius redtenbacheri TaxID=93214 RepID=UPI002FDCFA9C
MAGLLGYGRDAVRVKVTKCEGILQPEFRKFSVDPQITSFEVLQSILAKAFDIKGEFTVCYKAYDDYGQETYLSLLSDWDLDAAFLSASEPCLCLQVDLRPFEETSEDWDSVGYVDAPRPPAVETRLLQNRLPGLILNQVERTFNMVQRALSLVEEGPGAVSCQPPRSPLSDAEFRRFLDPVGQVTRARELRSVIYLGGIDPSLRKVVWKHILNVYPEGMSGKERMDYMKRKSYEYQALRDKWRDEVQQSHGQLRPEPPHGQLLPGDERPGLPAPGHHGRRGPRLHLLLCAHEEAAAQLPAGRHHHDPQVPAPGRGHHVLRPRVLRLPQVAPGGRPAVLLPVAAARDEAGVCLRGRSAHAGGAVELPAPDVAPGGPAPLREAPATPAAGRGPRRGLARRQVAAGERLHQGVRAASPELLRVAALHREPRGPQVAVPPEPVPGRDHHRPHRLQGAAPGQAVRQHGRRQHAHGGQGRVGQPCQRRRHADQQPHQQDRVPPRQPRHIRRRGADDGTRREVRRCRHDAFRHRRYSDAEGEPADSEEPGETAASSGQKSERIPKLHGIRQTEVTRQVAAEHEPEERAEPAGEREDHSGAAGEERRRRADGGEAGGRGRRQLAGRLRRVLPRDDLDDARAAPGAGEPGPPGVRPRVPAALRRARVATQRVAGAALRLRALQARLGAAERRDDHGGGGGVQRAAARPQAGPPLAPVQPRAHAGRRRRRGVRVGEPPALPRHARRAGGPGVRRGRGGGRR